jgi:hypothetical protein
MRYLCVFVVTSLIALGQSSTTTTARIPDLNGGYEPGSTYSTSKGPGGSSRVEYAPSINGTLAPRESVQEKVVREDGSGKVIERIVRRYDATGNPGPPEKTVIEERRAADGSTQTTSTVYRGDLNGNLQVYERTTSRAVTQGNATNTETTIERANIDGALKVAEKVSASLTRPAKDAEQQTITRMRVDANGNFYEAVREVTDKQTQAQGQVVENRAQYVSGTLTEQSVARTVTSASGAKTVVVDVFAPQAPGLSADPSGRLALKEQQVITSEPGPGGKVTQTVVSKKPTVSDANRLGPGQVISQSVCSGDCRNP